MSEFQRFTKNSTYVTNDAITAGLIIYSVGLTTLKQTAVIVMTLAY